MSQESPLECSERLSIPLEAAVLFGSSDVIDLHVDSYIWHRLVGYRLAKSHDRPWLGTRFFNQADLPRFERVGINGATWVITTNPLRTAAASQQAFARNLAGLKAELLTHPEVRLVRSASDYQAARSAGQHAAFLGIQGGSALELSLDALDILSSGEILRVTLVHLSSSRLGVTSSPLKRGQSGLTDFGRDYVKLLNSHKVAVDLAHIDRQGFFDALAVHDPSLPPIVTHTGVSGVHPHWRNLDDDQLRAIAERGGIIGIMFHSPFLGDGTIMGHFKGRYERVLDHIDHVIKTVGDNHVALGSDWDGAITTPRDMPTCLELPLLVAGMLRRGYSDERIQKVLGGNFLRVLHQLRG